MIPILYESGTTTFTTNGIGRLSDCISCLVTEERNGIFEVEFSYPISGAYYSEILEGRIITVSHDEQGDRQPFIIYARSAEISGKVKFFAHHISYLLSNIIVEPFTAVSVADAFNSFTHSNMNTNPFTFWTDNVTAGTVTVEVPSTIRSILGGKKGSILDVFGGEYKFDNFIVRNYAHRGANNGVTIRYGKNLVKINQKVDAEYLYNAVVPYWTDSDSNVVFGAVTAATGQTANLVSTLDLSQKFMEQPTVAQLNSAAQSWLDTNKPWIPKENLKIDFVSLWQTEEYKDIAPLERVRLCDTVTIYYPDLGVEATAKVIKVVWDALLERYNSIELGDARSTFADTVLKEATADIGNILEGIPTRSFIQEAIDHATELLTGGLGGHIVFLYDSAGKPTDMLVMDTEDTTTAIHVLRINVNGIGFSSTGVNGPFTSAWTLDGQFVADFITAGHMSFNRMQGGTISLGGADNGNGVLVVYDANGTEIGRWNKDGLTASGNFTLQNNYASFYAGSVLAYDASKTSLPSWSSLYGAALWINAYSAANPTGQISWGMNGQVTITKNDFSMRYVLINSDSTNLKTTQPTIKEYMKEDVRADYFNLVHNNKTRSGHIGLASDDYISMDTYSETMSGTVNYSSYSRATLTISKTNGYLIQGGVNRYTMHTPAGGYIVRLSGSVYFMNQTSSSAEAKWYIMGGGTSGYIQVQSSSSKRYKHDITDDICAELDAHKLYELPMKQFVFNSDHPLQYEDVKGKTIPGFIAEEVEEIYPSAAIHDNDGNVESWDERRIIPGMLKLIQEQHEEIEDLKQRLAKLEKLVETLK